MRNHRETEKGSKTIENGCYGGIKGINVAVMMIIIIAADISMAPRTSLAF